MQHLGQFWDFQFLLVSLSLIMSYGLGFTEEEKFDWPVSTQSNLYWNKQLKNTNDTIATTNNYF